MKIIEICSKMPDEFEEKINNLILESKTNYGYYYKKM
jgi:hypothetical protein